MLTSHQKVLSPDREIREPAGQIAARELETSESRERCDDVAAALESVA